MAEEVVARFTITVGQEVLTLPDIAHQLIVLDQAWVVATVFAAYRAGLNEQLEKVDAGFIPRPYDIRITKHSPLVVDVAVNDVLQWGLTSGAAAMFVYFVRKPRHLGSFFNDIVAGWHHSAADAEAAKRNAYFQRQINRELLGGSPPSPGADDIAQTSRAVERLSGDLARLNAEVVERNESD